MNNAYFSFHEPANEPIRGYMPASKERASLKAELKRQKETVVKIPLVIGGKEIFTDTTVKITMPHDHAHVLAECCLAGEKELNMAIEAAMSAKKAWAAMPWEHRASIFMKMGELLAGPQRDKINAATMLGQSKTAFQAEIDSACELTDFIRYNVYNAQELYKQQPNSTGAIWNRNEFRPLDGFVTALTPFNFTSIGGNLALAPALMGNTVLWKPSTTAVLSNYYFMKLMEEAGLPAGVINFVPCKGVDISKYVIPHKDFAGFHFTGSTKVFSGVWTTVGQNIANYKSYPRIVGETGGKDFIFAHKSADIEPLVAAIVRGAFEFQGQKCSAASRAYIPASIWETVKERVLAETAKLKVGDVSDFTTFMGAVIDKASFDNIKSYIDYANASDDAEVLCGSYDDSKGWFVYPTVILAKKPDFKTMAEEIFGPVITIYVYDDEKLDEALELCDKTSAYALTGAIFAQDRAAIIHMEEALNSAAGNFYINDKPTGAVVGQQPFGGARASGTNDKAGSIFNLIRWVNIKCTKENFVPSADITYPYMCEE